jgi:hypothetical protein
VLRVSLRSGTHAGASLTTLVVACMLGACVLVACAGGKGGAPGATDSTSAHPAATGADRVTEVDSASRPVVVTFHRDSLGVGAGASTDSVGAALNRAAARLREWAPGFEVLSVSPPIQAVRLAPRAGVNAVSLADSLRKHPWVAAAEVEGFRRPQR